jgi:hypothetical protein
MNSVIPAGTDWPADLQEWLQPFLAVFRRFEQRCWAPLYLQGLLGPGARKSVEPMAERVCPGQTQQLHHFVSMSIWSTAPLKQVLRKTADALVGSKDAVLMWTTRRCPSRASIRSALSGRTAVCWASKLIAKCWSRSPLRKRRCQSQFYV